LKESEIKNYKKGDKLEDYSFIVKRRKTKAPELLSEADLIN